MAKLSREKLLEENKFWEIIETTPKQQTSLKIQYEQLKAELRKLDKEELLGFGYWIHYYLWDSYNVDLWAVAYIALGGCSDDTFDYFRAWLISRGKIVYLNALTDAESLSNEFDKIYEGDSPKFEDFLNIDISVYEEKFGEDYENVIKDYEDKVTIEELDFDWEETEESLAKKCPKVYKKWWNSPFSYIK